MYFRSHIFVEVSMNLKVITLVSSRKGREETTSFNAIYEITVQVQLAARRSEYKLI
jgi:hypothetical protein